MSASAAIRGLAIWSSRPQIEPVEAGRTNLNFRVRDGNECYFARFAADLPHHGIRRLIEQQVARHVAAIGIGPPVIHTDKNVLVTKFLDGRTWSQKQQRSDQELARLGRLLARLHGASAPCDLPHFDPAAICRHYLAALQPASLAKQVRQSVERILLSTPPTAKRCLIHADLIPENILDDSGRLWLVDWEYAGLGEAETDLAMVAANFDLSPRQFAILLEAHANVSDARVKALVPAVVAREALWCMRELEVNGNRGDLAAYTEACVARLEGLA